MALSRAKTPYPGYDKKHNFEVIVGKSLAYGP